MLGLIESGRDAGAVMVPATGGPLNVFVDVPADYELPPVQSEHSNAIDLAGFEAIAWYVSFHVSKYGWGIYVAEDVLETYARRAFGGFTALSDREKLALGLQTVLDHELFHYWTSIWDEEWTRILPSAPRDRSQWHKCLVRTCATFIEKPLEWSDTPPKGNGGLGLRWGDAGLF